MEYTAAMASHYDLDRFGAGFPRFSLRQADVLFVVGTINHKLVPVLKTVYDQMCEPKWAIAFGVCTCTGSFFFDNYATVQGSVQLGGFEVNKISPWMSWGFGCRESHPQELLLLAVGLGHLLVVLSRTGEFQLGYVIPKGTFMAQKVEGLEAFRADIARMQPILADRVSG